MEKPQIEFPKGLVNFYDIAKGVGEVMLHAAFDAIHHEAHSSDSTHNVDEFDRSTWTPVQQEAARWGDGA